MRCVNIFIAFLSLICGHSLSKQFVVQKKQGPKKNDVAWKVNQLKINQLKYEKNRKHTHIENFVKQHEETSTILLIFHTYLHKSFPSFSLVSSLSIFPSLSFLSISPFVSLVFRPPRCAGCLSVGLWARSGCLPPPPPPPPPRRACLCFSRSLLLCLSLSQSLLNQV